MPVTPFHFGAGVIAKAASPRWFSLRVYILTQILIDLESAWNMYSHNDRVHTYLHSFAGAGVAAFVAATIAHFYNQLAPKVFSPQRLREPIFRPPQIVETWTAAVFGAFSHVLFDALMHSDMRPLWPFSTENPFLFTVSLRLLHLGLLVLGAVGIVIWFIRNRLEVQK